MIRSKELISALYVAVFERAPDYSGLRYWSLELDQGLAYSHIVNGFIGHPLYEHTYGRMNNQQLIEAFYQNILGAEGDAGGIKYWVGELNKGKHVSEVLASFIYGALDFDASKQGNLSHDEWQKAIYRQDILQNKVDTGIYYSEYLGKNSDILNNNDSIDVQNEPQYINAKNILKNITNLRASVEKAKEFVENNYKYTPEDDGFSDFGALGLWAWLAALLGAEWDDTSNPFDGFEGFGWDADELDLGWLYDFDSSINWNDSSSWNGLLDGNWDWAWYTAFIDALVNWWQAILGTSLDGFNSDGFNGFGNFADLGDLYGELGLLGQFEGIANFDADMWG